MTTTIPPDLDDAIYNALRNSVGCELAFEATEAVVNVIASYLDAQRDMNTARRMNQLIGFDLGGLS